MMLELTTALELPTTIVKLLDTLNTLHSRAVTAELEEGELLAVVDTKHDGRQTLHLTVRQKP